MEKEIMKTDLIVLIREMRLALLDAKHIIESDLGTEIESIENALEKAEQYKGSL